MNFAARGSRHTTSAHWFHSAGRRSENIKSAIYLARSLHPSRMNAPTVLHSYGV